MNPKKKLILVTLLCCKQVKVAGCEAKFLLRPELRIYRHNVLVARQLMV